MTANTSMEVRVPDIGDFRDIPVIEILVRPGQSVAKDEPLVTLESDKATMEVPAPAAGVVGALTVNIGDKVSEGHPLLMLESAGTPPPAAPAAAPQPEAAPHAAAETAREAASPANHHAGPESHPIARPERIDGSAHKPHASPGVRKYARELGVDLAHVEGTGPKDRILTPDVQEYVRQMLSGDPAGGPSRKTLRASAAIDALDRLRNERDAAAKEPGEPVPIAAFVVKAAGVAMNAVPAMCAAVTAGADAAKVEGPAVIAVVDASASQNAARSIRGATVKGVRTIAAELVGDAAAMPSDADPARAAGRPALTIAVERVAGADLAPAAHPPDAPVLSIGQPRVEPVWDGRQFVPRLELSLAFAYDRRSLADDDAARFVERIVSLLEDFRRIIL